ncbi:hypothetical protein [Hymenobacter metallicola]|uniref:hypothetical protein n=1 Tax=Hymenobacter metallicola TaxID=2563114 RepID=UPI001436B043|nr:hypothetical protein [Hymenobacter metallicola]
MKQPHEYLPTPTASPLGLVIPHAQAVAAIEAALQDAEKYRTLLQKAIRNSQSPHYGR